MTYQALTTAITGLRAAQQQLAVISNNVTNATTPGYNRQILPQEAHVQQSTGKTVGVLTSKVIRTVDMNLQRELWTQVSASSMQNVQLQYLQQIQNFNGPPDKEFSIAAEIADLRDSFSMLSDTPDDTDTLEQTLNKATMVADKFNDYADLITQLRNDTQGDLQSSITRVNGLLKEITNINIQIKGAEHFNHSVAGLQDQRDIAIKELTEEMDISFFERSDGVLVVQTRDGLQLADDIAYRLEFQSVPVGAGMYYPNSIQGLFVVSEANGVSTKIDITERAPGGRVGGLIELRDEVLPSYQAQLDELAYQLSHRLELQGLTLFTDQTGSVPAGTAPDPSTLPLPTPVPYVDYSRNIRVNSDVVRDITLLQRGTYAGDTTIPTGDNSLIRRVLEYGFGSVNYQTAIGTTNLDDVGGGAADLQEWLGLASANRIVSSVDLASYSEIDDGNPATQTDITSSLSDYFLLFPNNDQFQITFEEGRTGLGPVTVTIDLSDAQTNFPVPGSATDALDQITQEINSQIALAGVPAGLAANATRNTYGQLIIESRGNVTVDGSSFAGSMGTSALSALGIAEGVFTTEDPSFTVQVGNSPPVTITIEPGDTIVELIDKLEWDAGTQTGVPGLFVDYDAVGGTITIRPGIDDSNWSPLTTEPEFGGDLTIIGGPFSTNGALNIALPDNVSIVSALFGSFTGAGPTLVENSPLANIGYQNETTQGSGNFVNFRKDYLGPNAGISTGVFSADSLIDYAQKFINKTSQDYLAAESAYENEDTLRGILQRQFSDQSGVNIDEEMSYLIVVQTAYAAAARTVTAADEMFQELLNSIRR